MNNSIDNRITVNEGDFIMKKSVPGEYSLTLKEFATKSKLRDYIMFSKFDGKKIELRNDDKTKYYSVEDGTIFKYIEDSFSFYRLNLNDFVWDCDQTLASIYYDTYLSYQEIVDFEDYYPNREDLDFSNGRQP